MTDNIRKPNATVHKHSGDKRKKKKPQNIHHNFYVLLATAAMSERYIVQS